MLKPECMVVVQDIDTQSCFGLNDRTQVKTSWGETKSIRRSETMGAVVIHEFTRAPYLTLPLTIITEENDINKTKINTPGQR